MSAFACVDDLVVAIHEHTARSGQRFSFGVTGGGSTSLPLLMAQPGASTTVLEFTCTYASESTQDFVDRDSAAPLPPRITSFASAGTAHALARAALARSVCLLTSQAPDIGELVMLKGACGIGATASIASKSWKRGGHRLFVALSDCERDFSFSVDLFKGAESAPFRSRQQEDDLCGKIIVSVVAFACGLLDNSTLLPFLRANGLDASDSFSMGEPQPKALMQSLLDSSIDNILCIPQPTGPLLRLADVPIHILGKHAAVPPRIVVLPGSFNPLHAGHAASLESCIALCHATDFQLCGEQAAGGSSRKACPLYELSVFNVDKPPIPLQELEARLDQFSRQNVCILLTKLPRFIDKARAYPGMSYVIGIDTLLRLVDPVYTSGSSELMAHALASVVRDGSQFFVLPRTFGAANIPAKFGLQLGHEELLTYAMVSERVPESIRAAFKEVALNAHGDVSSSALRRQRQLDAASSPQLFAPGAPL